MIAPQILQKLMSSKHRNGEAKIIRPCEPSWATMPKPVILEVMAIISDAAKQKNCKVEDLCVQVHLAGDMLERVKIYDKVRKAVKGWRRIAAAWNVLWKGKI